MKTKWSKDKVKKIKDDEARWNWTSLTMLCAIKFYETNNTCRISPIHPILPIHAHALLWLLAHTPMQTYFYCVINERTRQKFHTNQITGTCSMYIRLWQSATCTNTVCYWHLRLTRPQLLPSHGQPKRTCCILELKSGTSGWRAKWDGRVVHALAQNET